MQLNDHKVSTINVDRSKTIVSKKVGKEKAMYKFKLKDQLDKVTENYKVSKTSINLLKNAGAAPKNKPSNAASHSTSPTQRVNQLFVKKALQPNRPSYNSGWPGPKDILSPNPVRTQTCPESIPTIGKGKSAGLTAQTDTQTALLMQVV